MKEDETDVNAISRLTNFQETYRKRRLHVGDNFPSDELWITSPRNLQKCKMLGKEPYGLLHELRKWYDKK